MCVHRKQKKQRGTQLQKNNPKIKHSHWCVTQFRICIRKRNWWRRQRRWRLGAPIYSLSLSLSRWSLTNTRDAPNSTRPCRSSIVGVQLAKYCASNCCVLGWFCSFAVAEERHTHTHSLHTLDDEKKINTLQTGSNGRTLQRTTNGGMSCCGQSGRYLCGRYESRARNG